MAIRSGPGGGGMMQFIWIKPPSGMGAECKRRADAIEPELLGRMGEIKGSVLDYMQNNAPWTNRTTDARNGLRSSANITGKGSVTVTAWHTVPYGKFLELGTSKMSAYPIINPALQAHYAATKAVMDRIAGSG
jgi:HK97 gp10 family phage protein